MQVSGQALSLYILFTYNSEVKFLVDVADCTASSGPISISTACFVMDKTYHTNILKKNPPTGAFPPTEIKS